MKNFKLSTKTAIAGIFMLLAVFYSCSQGKDIDKSFYGSIVIGKYQNGLPQYFLCVKKPDSTFVTIEVKSVYFDYYESDDTIK